MIQTEYLEPEVFTNRLVVTGTEKYEKDVLVDVSVGIFGRTKPEARTETRERNTYGLDDELLKTFPTDIQKQIKKKSFNSQGYQYYMFHGGVLYNEASDFTRGFPFTLNEFYAKHKINQENLINLEYCKKECDNVCNVIGAYITWDDGK